MAEIDSAELSEWMAFYRLEPFGGQRGDFQAALVAQTVAAAGGAKHTTLGDFLLDFDGSRRPQPQTEVQKQFLLDLFFHSL